MLKLGNFQSCVLIENEAATEYNVQYSADGSLASCWIASELGKAFIISWTYTSQHDQHFGGRLLIDGEDMIRAFCPPTTAPRTIQLGHKITSKNTLRPFTFAAIHLTDDDSYLDAPQPSSLGNIKLEIWRLHQPTSDTPLAVSEDEGCISERIVHERAKKIASHRVKLGAPVPTQQRWTTAQASCTDKQPVATFEFMYRTREFLQAQGIAPPAPPTPIIPKVESTPNTQRLSAPAPAPVSKAAPIVPKMESTLNTQEETDPDLIEVRKLEVRLQFSSF
ncbi:hypothetical protein HGRIS_004564 [Hohenbuehelia grisea]|uniref:DUF7918 domain-containing protein n=1 Tax=Hohenbuehelia grisea TaxID=104357 RepID=A0ABR3JCE9_9AGAR